MHFLLFYTYVPDVLERRAQFRGAHLKHAWAAQSRGELLLAGALTEPVDGGVLWFSASDKSVVEKFATDDPTGGTRQTGDAPSRRTIGSTSFKRG